MKCILIYWDTARADHTSVYGYGKDTTPFLEELAGTSSVFERAYSTDVPTQPSYTSMLTSRRGIDTGVVCHREEEQIPDTMPVLPEVLARAGIETGAVSTLYHMKKYFARGFRSNINPLAEHQHLVQRVTGDRITDYAIPWVRQHASEDFFLFLHYWDPHTPYFPPPEYRSMFAEGPAYSEGDTSLDVARSKKWWPFTSKLIDAMGGDINSLEYIIAQYDAEIRFSDDQLRRLYGVLRDLGIDDETMVIVTADHGESMDEHGIFFDHGDVYEPTIRVPLVIRDPRVLKAGRVKGYVQNIDLAPTICSFLGVDIPTEFEGKDLGPMCADPETPGREVVISNQGLWSAKRTIIRDGWKYIRTHHQGFWETPGEELFHIDEDPLEEVDLLVAEPEKAGALRDELAAWEAARLKGNKDPLTAAVESDLPPLRWIWELVEGEEGDYDSWRGRMGW